MGYHLKSFLKDLTWIRKQTFKKPAIKSAFQKSGTYHLNAKACVEYPKGFKPPEKRKAPLGLSTTPVNVTAQEEWGPRSVARLLSKKGTEDQRCIQLSTVLTKRTS